MLRRSDTTIKYSNQIVALHFAPVLTKGNSLAAVAAFNPAPLHSLVSFSSSHSSNYWLLGRAFFMLRKGQRSRSVKPHFLRCD